MAKNARIYDTSDYGIMHWRVAMTYLVSIRKTMGDDEADSLREDAIRYAAYHQDISDDEAVARYNALTELPAEPDDFMKDIAASILAVAERHRVEDHLGKRKN